MPYIYKIENQINHKVYIGKTLYTIERRWKQHQQNLQRNDLKHLKLYNAILKYGLENFQVSEVEYVENPDILSEREQYWINYYDSFYNGYNCSLGGEGLQLYNYDLIWQFWQEGKNIKQIASLLGCNDFVVRTCLDLHNVSTEERKARSNEDILETYNKLKQPVQQIDINTNQIINTFPSISDAANFINGDNSNISKACKNQRVAYGYKWQYIGIPQEKRNFSKRKVEQFDLKTGRTLNIYESISEAARAVDGDSSYISKVCRGIQKSSKGFGWRFNI